MKCFSILLLVLLLVNTVFAQSEFANPRYIDPYNPEYEANEILVKFKDDVQVTTLKSSSGIVQTGISSFDKFSKTNRVVGMEKIFKNATRLKSAKIITIQGETRTVPQLHNIYKLTIQGEKDIPELIKELETQPEIEFAEPNYFVYSQEVAETQTAPNDPLYGDQWYLTAINAEAAWVKEPTGGAGQVIGILDTGVDYDHEDLNNNIWENVAEVNGIDGEDDDGNGFIDDKMGWDWVNNDAFPKDDNSHGTHVAGIAAAEQNNSVGISGVAFGAKIMPLKVLQSSGRGNSTDLAAAITYAANNGATVINMSLGSYGESLTVKAALENAYSTVLPVAAAGNNGYAIDENDCNSPISQMYPASYSFVLGVQATQSTSSPANCFDNWLAGFSNYDATGTSDGTLNYEVKAPGVGLKSTIPGGSYRNLNGTSMAAPVVAATVAMMKTYQSQSNEQIFAKIIQSTGNTLDASSALDYTLVPDLHFVSYTLEDELNGGDNDGAADAGETIEIWLSVKNAGGFADSVYTNLSLGEFEDPSVATIQKSTQYIGDISAYASLTGVADKWKITINSDVVNDRDIIFEYVIDCKNGAAKNGEIILTIQNGEELSGIMDTTLILSPNKNWIINNSFLIGTNGILIINPGVSLTLSKGISNQGTIFFNGKSDSTINVTGIQYIQYVINGGIVIANYTHFNNLNCQYLINGNKQLIRHCIFDEITAPNTGRLIVQPGGGGKDTMLIENSIFRNISYDDYLIYHNNLYKAIIKNNNFYNIDHYEESSVMIYSTNNMLLEYNNYSKIIDGYFIAHQSSSLYPDGIYNKNNYLSIREESFRALPISGTYLDTLSRNNYWGTSLSDEISNVFYDFHSSSSYSEVSYSPFLTQPSDSAHGCVWKVEVNEIDPQDEHLDPVGAEELKFDVYFNKGMDKTSTPQLSFGVREPFTQNIVTKNGAWNTEGDIWTAYYDVGLETGDGINQIRVTEAMDTAGFEIPIEVERFQFNIQAAGAASLEFMATPGIGKVELEWPASHTDDILGYNLYRCYNLTDTTTTDTFLINTELLTDTIFMDMAVIPDTTYHYLYKTVGTDMQETDYSKGVAATPFNAANGDANGDQSVDVADIITIVNYISGDNPQPFLFDAADVNYDAAINVLDIVGVVNLISAAKSGELFAATQETAKISIENGTVYVECAQELAGIQFTLEDISENQQVEILAALQGFEVIRKEYDNRLLILAFNFNDKTFGPGRTAILQLNGENTWIQKAVLANSGGRSVNFEMSGTATANRTVQLTSEFKLGQNYPNPFEDNTIIPFMLEENTDNVSITIFDMTGRKIRAWDMKNLNSGNHQVEWNSEGNPGVYIYKMRISNNEEMSFTQSKRMVVTQ